MKEKNKNILKGLGVGALACFGMLTFTGCSVELSQEQINKIVHVVERSDKFMDDTLDLLEKQNAKLSKEEGWDLYQTALTIFLTNQEGIRNNIKITAEDLEGDKFVTYHYNDLQGTDIVLETGSELRGNDRITFVAEEDSDNYVYHYAKDGTEYEKSLLGEGVTENYSSILLYVDNGVTSEDVVGCELLENGNYELSFVQTFKSVNEDDEIMYYNYVVYEITSDGTFISQKTNFAEVDLNKDGAVTERFGGTITYEYGVVQESDFADILAEAKAAELTEEAGE